MHRLPPEMNSHASDTRWYTRRQGVVRGPFSAENVTRYILLGRIRLDDELSQDRENWSVAGQLTSLLPPELESQSCWDDYETLVNAHMNVDERTGDRRNKGLKNYLERNAERRTSPERRRADENALLSHYLRVRLTSSDRGKHSASGGIRPVLLSVGLAILVIVWLNPIQYL